jgi:NAD(P)H dehydrogenase (quinone)
MQHKDLTMNILLVVAHPRKDSFTQNVAEQFKTSLIEAGHIVEVADLVAENFDPGLHVVDEPDWADQTKPPSEAVRQEVTRIERNSATILVFPVWWWSLPAVLKGWVDRVWTHGFAYGTEVRYPHDHVWMVGVAGVAQDGYLKRGYHTAMDTQLKVGILEFCGVRAPRLELLFNALGEQSARHSILTAAQELASEFNRVVAEPIG